jgi:hypothetical protein
MRSSSFRLKDAERLSVHDGLLGVEWVCVQVGWVVGGGE